MGGEGGDMTRQLDDRVETYDEIIPGACSVCGTAFDLVIGSSCTGRRDGRRYARDKTTAWGAFRCRKCSSLIEDTWKPSGVGDGR